jgi:predicted enzyme related to lactoylglutathione lyase
MPTRDTAPIGAPCWVDLMTSDSARARAFYAEVFGWTAEEPSEEFGGYFMFLKDGAPVAGGMPSTPDSGPDRWTIYLATDDAVKTCDAAAANGGQVIVPVMDVGDVGSMAVVADPGGAGIGIWQAKEFAGFGVITETGAPSWFELHTRAYQESLDFYRSVFRWDTQVLSDTPEFSYSVLRNGEEMLAGVLDAGAMLPEGAPGQWSVYFGADDADATVAKIVKLGGSIVQPAEDTPYGRLATATDPTGTVFKVVAPNEAMPAK